MQSATIFKNQTLHISRMHAFRRRVDNRSVLDANHRMRDITLRSPTDRLTHRLRSRCKDDVAFLQGGDFEALHEAFTRETELTEPAAGVYRSISSLFGAGFR